MKSIKYWAILDSGATSHFLFTTSPITNITPSSRSLNVKLPDYACVSSTHTCTLNLPQLPTRAREGYIIPGLALHSLMSVVKLCNSGCEVIFTKTWQSIFVNFISHPALHSFMTDIRECDANPGMMCPSLALVGICGRFIVHMWVDYTHAPSGSLKLSGLLAGMIFVIGDVVTRKWLVATESSIAQFFIDFMLMSTVDKIVLAA